MSSRLTTPLTIGRAEAPSRVVFAAHRTNFATHRRRFQPRHAAYYGRRAEGGAGVVVLEGASVHPSDWPYEYAPEGYAEGIVDGYGICAEAIRAHGALALVQLTHAGGQGSSHYSQSPLWAPSPVPEVNSREVPKEMEERDIEAVVAGFRASAAYAVEGGLDGVEVNAGQYSLLRQFLSPLTNQRSDGYGGALENRLRFTREVLRAVREQIGAAPILGLRLSGDEYAPWAGLQPKDAAEVAEALCAGGAVDYLAVTSGSIYSLHQTRAGLYAEPGHGAHLAGVLKARVSVPVFAQGSVVDVAMAEALLEEGSADAVEMTRALIADPNLPRKVAAGEGARVRPCTLCNQDCVVETVQNPRVSCMVNPEAGYEAEEEFAALRRARPARDVLVVGGGPAGLEGARVAALRGHRVTLVDGADSLGGAVRLAAAAPGRDRLRQSVAWLEDEVRRLGVAVETGTPLDLEGIAERAPDAVVLAVGATPRPYRYIDVAAAEIPIWSPREVLSSTERGDGRHAVVLDEAGDHPGMASAEALHARGYRVTMVSADMFVGQRLTATMELTPFNQRAAGQGISLRPIVEVEAVVGREVRGVDRFGREPVVLEADAVVSASFEGPLESLYFALEEAGIRVLRAGDCVAPRKIGPAILEGHRAGRAV